MSPTTEKILSYSIGLMAVIERLNLQTPLPATRSKISSGARKTRIENGIIYERYPKTYGVEGLYENLKFAMRYEPLDLGVWQAACSKIEPQTIQTWIKSERKRKF